MVQIEPKYDMPYLPKIENHGGDMAYQWRHNLLCIR